MRSIISILILCFFFAGWTFLHKPLSRISQARFPDHAGRVNFLVMGIGGGNHEGADLTDSIFFVSIDKTLGDTALISIPRDLWVYSLRAKINTAYHYGNQKQTNGGFILAKSAISEVLNQPVDYVVIIDFSGFEKLIDRLGGIDVKVARTLDDYQFPITGKEDDLCGGDPEYKCRYEHLHVESGVVHMDGALALKYVRSRHAEGEEGTDYDRSRRQQEVILAIRNKVFSTKTLFNFKTMSQIFSNLSSSIITDIPQELYLSLFNLGLKVSHSQIRTTAIGESLVSNPPVSANFDYQWVLIPKDNNYSSLASYVKDFLTKSVQK